MSTKIILLLAITTIADAFHTPSSTIANSFGIKNCNEFTFMKRTASFNNIPQMSSSDENEENKNSGVVELIDDDEGDASPPSFAAPFLSQGEISEEALNPDLSDPKQTRVIIYIILSLIPVLFLIPLMLGSRDLIPADMLPPVEM